MLVSSAGIESHKKKFNWKPLSEYEINFGFLFTFGLKC